MRSDLLERLMRIVARTGERHVLVDASLPEPLVVLPLAAYEGLLSGEGPAPAAAVRPEPLPEPPPAMAAPAAWDTPAPTPAPETENALNEEEKFYLEPID